MASHDESEDEELKLAIALSLQDPARIEERNDSKTMRPSLEGLSFTLSSLNRTKMEEDRLARRAAKRTRISDQDDDVVEITCSKKRTRLPTNCPTDQPLIPYPHGTVKRTWARGYDRSDDDIQIEQIFQKDQLLVALLSSFQWDEAWLLGKIDLSRTKVLLAASATNDAQKESMRRNAPENVRFCFPAMYGPGSMHSKLQILKFPNYLRIVIPTGNLVPYDWGETGTLENMVFLIDLPLVNSVNTSSETTLFRTHLEQYLQAMGVEAAMISSLAKYDFAKTGELGFVYSIPGGHIGSSFSRVGFAGLGTTIADLGLATSEPIEVDFACASLGAIKYDLVKSIYSACQGIIDEDLLGIHKVDTYSNENNDCHRLQQHFRIYFPSHNTVISSRGGKNAAGTICVQEKWWQASTFPKELMRDCVNTRKGLLMHSKLILVRQKGIAATDAEKKAAWAYVGSANLSESAWGRIVRDRSTGQRKIVCRNWECGVVIPVHTTSEQNSPMNMNMFARRVPIPMQVPGRRYSRGDHPWFFHKA